MIDITVEKLLKAYRNTGYDLFENDDYDLNIIGVRSNAMVPDKFDDAFAVLWKGACGWNLVTSHGTTDPGLYYLKNPLNVLGTGIVAPGQHKGVWMKGLHKGYPALVQKGIMKVFRDNNRDGNYDMGNIIEAPAGSGFNMHRARDEGESTIVGKWSAGCQVRANDDDHEVLMELVDKQLTKHGNSFSYTLFLESEI